MASVAYGGVAASGFFTQSGYLAAVGGGVPTAAQVSTAAYMPYIGFGIGIAAALVDTFVLMPALRGKGQRVGETPKLVDVPTGSNEPGAPRIWALGARVRVPTHVIWQQAKQRETTSGSNKAGTLVQQRKVYFDAAIALNDRPVRELSQLNGNGKLILFKTRNIVGITTSAMTLSIVAGRIRLTMSSTLDPDFSDIFKVKDAVELRGWIQSAGININTGFWKVHTIQQHTTTPSYMDLTAYDGQTIAGIAATGGTPFDPAIVRRVDDYVFDDDGLSLSYRTVAGQSSWDPLGFSVGGYNWKPYDIFQLNDRCRLIVPGTSGIYDGVIKLISYSGTGVNGDVLFSYQIQSPLFPSPPSGTGVLTVGSGASNPPRITYETPAVFSNGVFPATYNPDSYFYSGSETQTPSALLEANKVVGDVPAYRGMAYQVFDDFYASLFGDQLPYSMEALIACDRTMDWPQALRAILCDRYALPQTAVDATGVSIRPFLGYYIRGPLPAVTALQPLLLAGQIMTQDRDGTLVFNEFANADEIAVENGGVFSDFGTRIAGDTIGDDKWRIEDAAIEDMPTKVGVRHQDPDNIYAAGYQFFGLRNPEGVDHTNEQELDLSQLVMTRREAANLAATVLRRSWVNRRTYRFVLPASYIHLLESDLVTWTDDEGVDHVARIIQRDIGSDFRVGITAIAEDLDLAVAGSPVQSAAGSLPQLPTPAAGLDVVIVDAPAVREGQNRKPGVHIAVGFAAGSWSGAAIYESVDGTTWDLIDIASKRAATGTFETDLGSGTVAEYVGLPSLPPLTDSSYVTVTMTPYGGSQLTSRTNKEIAAGANWCALVRPDGTTEIAAFSTVTALGNNQFTLSNWLRGLRGTGHPYSKVVLNCPAGTRIVLLNGDTYYREFAGDVTPQALAYKIVPAGLGLEDVEQINVVTQRRNALPLPVRTLTKTINPTTFSARFTVQYNWSRAVLPLGTQPPHPMDEPLEAYRFTIYDPAGLQVRRIKTITASGTGSNTIRDRWIDYPAAEQSADGYTPGASTLFAIDVQQVGEYGLGPSVLRKF